jgi:hypothetical protein
MVKRMASYKVFKFGSCRSELGKGTANKWFYGNHYTHSTREVLQYLKMFKDKSIFEKCKHPTGIMHNSRTFLSRVDDLARQLEEADVVYIEISTLKDTTDADGYSYREDHANPHHHDPLDVSIYSQFKQHIMTSEEIVKDLAEIKSLVNKPIIVQSHINIKFDGLGSLASSNYVLLSRETIDKAIVDSGLPSVLLKNVLKFDDWKEVCTDTIHFTPKGLELINAYVENLINQIMA